MGLTTRTCRVHMSNLGKTLSSQWLLGKSITSHVVLRSEVTEVPSMQVSRLSSCCSFSTESKEGLLGATEQTALELSFCASTLELSELTLQVCTTFENYYVNKGRALHG